MLIGWRVFTAACVIFCGITKSHAALPLTVQAVSGTPVGAGRVSVVLEQDSELLAAATGALQLREANGRVLYPVVAGEGVGRLLRKLAGEELAWGPERFEIYFLFYGDGPLELELTAATTRHKTSTPSQAPRLHRNMLTRWWREYRKTMREQSQTGDYSPIVENYLTNMLGHRLGMILPPARVNERGRSSGQQMWDLLTGAETLAQETLIDVVTGQSPPDAPLHPLPEPLEWDHPPASHEAAHDGDTAIEPIAGQVPDDCFYVRFGKFSNFLWLSDLTEEAGGDIQRMVTLRGVQRNANDLIQRQLAIEELPFAELLGDKVIADVALIGRDMMLQHGAAIGVLLQETGPVVGPGLKQLRASVAQREAPRGCRLEEISLSGQTVSLLATPDNSVRSFYVQRGPFHLVTNCRAIMESFLALPQSKHTLAANPDFRAIRRQLPANGGDTVFVFLPRRFFAGLASPSYQVELARRLRSATEVRLYELARQAYQNECDAGWIVPTEPLRNSTVSIEELVRQGLLPDGFGQRADDSRLALSDTVVFDSIRGNPGTFLPIPDVEVAGATDAELACCQTVTRLYESGWRSWDPIAVAIQRQIVAEVPGRERIVVEARVAPFERRKYDRWLSVLGQPTTERIVPRAEDVLTVEAVVDGGRLAPDVTDHHLLFCLRDAESLPSAEPGKLLGKLQMVHLAPAYIAAWPELGLLRLIPLRGLSRDLGDGYSALPFGLYRRDLEGFIRMSFHPDLLALPKPDIEQSDTPAQLRVRLRDTSATGWTGWINAVASDRALRASLGNVRFMHTLEQQLGVPPDDSRALAETLVGGTLACALGGEYRSEALEGEAARWKSTAWSTTWPLRLGAPEAYQAPLVQWLRGLDLDVALYEDVAVVNAQVMIQRHVDPAKEKNGGSLFQLFK